MARRVDLDRRERAELTAQLSRVCVPLTYPLFFLFVRPRPLKGATRQPLAAGLVDGPVLSSALPPAVHNGCEAGAARWVGECG